MAIKDSKNTFYEMIKSWTVKDYNTPGIKAEVIIDMLCSDFVADIVGEALGDKPMELIAKEFPIPTIVNKKDGKWQVSSSNRSARVDYLLGEGKNLYFVELKTDKNSYDDEQLLRMVYAATQYTKDPESLLRYFKRVTDNAKGNAKEKYDWYREKYLKKASLNKFSSISIVYLTLGNMPKFRSGKDLKVEGDGCTVSFTRSKDFGSGSKPIDNMDVWFGSKKQEINNMDVWFVDLLTAELKDNNKWNDENGVKAILKECSKSK